MIIYVVENGNFIEGYYRDFENAKKAVRAMDELIEKFKDNPHVDAKPYWIEEIKTED